MGENQTIEKLLEKMTQLLKEIEKLRQSRESAEIPKQSGKTTVLGNCVNLAQTEEAISSQAPALNGTCSNWILDSGASAHVTGKWSEFASYTPHPPMHKETIQTADGTYQPVKGVGTVKCTPSITLSSVLYAPSFPVSLVSMSSLVDDIDCRIIADRYNCIIEERKTGRRLGIGVRHKGLWYLDRRETDEALCTALTVVTNDDEARLILQHCRLGHMSFDTMSKIFPEEMKKVDKEKLVCDACEFGKHTRTSYVSRGLRSTLPFVLIHSDVWTSPVVSVSGMKYFVTFIDCYSRMTWIYLLKHKSEVLTCFKDFYAYVQNRFNASIQIIRTDNGTEYVNNEFGNFLSQKGILHQTSCPDTSPQNGVAERKNRHLLEVARSLMFTMNVPKFLWSEAVMTATYLINRMPSRVLGMKTPYEMIYGQNEFIVPPKVFGCTCFVRDHRPSVGKLDPRAVKCIFIGYPSGQKGYKCWSPSERRTFVSMDMTFRESEPFYGEKTDLSSLFDFDSPSTIEASREGESELLRTKEHEPSRVVVGSIPSPTSEERWTKPNEEENLRVSTRRQATSEERWRKPNEEENLKVYTRRKSQHEQQQQQVPTTSDTQVQGEQHVQQQVPTTSDTQVQGSNMLQQVLKLMNCLMTQVHLLRGIQWTCPLP